jgi:hypothetical protein
VHSRRDRVERVLFVERGTIFDGVTHRRSS